MKVGIVGLGKLGFPVGIAFSHAGHDVCGFDVNRERMDVSRICEREAGIPGGPTFDVLRTNPGITFASDIQSLVDNCELVFIAVQTPHEPEFEGISVLPKRRADFDYLHLERAIQEVNCAARKPLTVAIVSTVLPGTLRPRIENLPLNRSVNWVYNPFFIAMGTVVQDVFDPEFVLLGKLYCDTDTSPLISFYRSFLPSVPIHTVLLESAELAKVAYNTFIGIKIVFANSMMELAHHINGCDVDEVMRVLQSGYRRIISTKYLTPGMGDGGGCHPRDNVALSWLAKKHGLSYDLFEAIMVARQEQAGWLTELMRAYRLPKVILGRSFKPESNLVTGSPAVLCCRLLEEAGEEVTCYDPFIDVELPKAAKAPAVFLVATKHAQFRHFSFPQGSVVIDPHRYLPETKGVEIIRLGSPKHLNTFCGHSEQL